MTRVTTRKAEIPRDRLAILRVLRQNLPEAVAGSRFDWAYLDNPNGHAHVWLAETSDGEVIGTSAAFPRTFRVRGHTLKGLVLSDFAIDSSFRTLGPALALLRATLRPIEEGDFDFALDHPSESMLAVYRRMGGEELGRQTRYVRLLQASGVARRRWGSGVKSSVLGTFGDIAIRASDNVRRAPRKLTVDAWEGEFSDAFGDLQLQLEQRFAVLGDRSVAYLNWRYRSGVRFDYVNVAVRSGQRLMGYGVLQKDSGRSLTIVEFVCPADADIERALMTGLVDTSRSIDAESLQASCAGQSAWAAVLERHRFSAREQSTGPVVFSGRSDGLNESLKDIDNWWITDGDRDG